MAAKTRYEDGEMYGVLLPYFCGVEGMERGKAPDHTGNR